MKYLIYAFALLLFGAPVSGRELSLEEVFGRPEGHLPRRFAFSPDGTKLTYLLAGERGLSDLWAMDLATGERTKLVEAGRAQKLSNEERAARERRRERGRGVTEYAWQPGGDAILIPRSGDLFLWRDGATARLTETEEPERNARWSPDGSKIAYVRGKNLFVLEVATAKETQLTTDGGGAIACGLPEFIAMEELGRHEGFWWAPDSQRIAYVRTDVHRIPEFHVPDLLDVRNEPARQRYPRPGDPNAIWSLHVAGKRPKETIHLDDEYLVRVDWSPGGDLYVQTANRLQTSLRLWKRTELVHEEKDGAWIGFHSDLRFVDGRILWSSEKSGSKRLRYLDGKPITEGGVAAVAGVDGERVYYLRDERRERKLYSVTLDGKRGALLTPEPGFHGVTMSEDGRWIVDSYSRATEPPRIVLRKNDGTIVREIARGRPVEGLVEPEFLTVRAGAHELAAMLFRPEREDPAPAIVSVYAGPGSRAVWDRWRGSSGLWHQRMVQRGYAVFVVDGRGTRGYGRDFCRVVDRRLCHWEVKDQASAAHWLGRQGFVDPERIGIWGWSYGGTMVLQCLQEAGDVFAAGAAVAPVTDWRDYDTAYTERYLGLPDENPTNYRLSSPLHGVEKLNRPLLLAHGVRDDNVHFIHAMKYVDAAQKAGKLIETDFYPRGKHGIGGKRERMLLFERMERFFDREIGGGR